ncbi:MAG: hypothetical protein ABMA13_23560 [Chthoniobacteraceae bacterium]
MAFNPAPSNWIPNWSEDGTDITVPIASFPELTAGEADAATGDIRKLAYAIAEKLYMKFVSEAAGDDAPAQMQITKGQSLNPSTGKITVTYAFTFVLTPAGLDVSAEP